MSLTFIENLENYRTDRPDEWTMDEFIRDAKKLQQERDDLSMHLAKIQRAHSGYEWSPAGHWDSEAYISDVSKYIQESPKQ